MKISCTINGKRVETDIDPRLRLLDMLREILHLTGTKEGCGEGECGACTILMDGAAVNSCLIPAPQADGTEILTIEGLAPSGEELHPIQSAFIEKGAIQCGFCTPGMELSAYHLLTHNSHPSETEIREALSGNLCRCTGYTKIVEAIADSAEKMTPKDIKGKKK